MKLSEVIPFLTFAVEVDMHGLNNNSAIIIPITGLEFLIGALTQHTER